MNSTVQRRARQKHGIERNHEKKHAVRITHVSRRRYTYVTMPRSRSKSLPGNSRWARLSTFGYHANIGRLKIQTRASRQRNKVAPLSAGSLEELSGTSNHPFWSAHLAVDPHRSTRVTFEATRRSPRTDASCLRASP